MSRHLLYILVFLFFAFIGGKPAMAMSFDVTGVKVSVQSSDAVKARDMAITQAQRQAFATLVGRSTDQIASVTDAQIARLVRGFSVQGERLASRSYTANFTIRFNPNMTTGFVQANGLDLIPQTQGDGPIVANSTTTTSATPSGTATTTTQTVSGEAAAGTTPAQAESKAIVVLPILDIGARRVLWDDPNPWRDIWQKKDYSQPNLPLRVPLSDVDDVTDIPDANFLSGGQANISHMLERYGAKFVYVIVAKNQGPSLNPSGGMSLSLYRHDGTKLSFLRKNMIRPRPGYLFDDAVPAAIQMIIMAENNKDAPDAEPSNENDAYMDPAEKSAASVPGTMNPAVTANKPFVATVPYQSLAQWVGIQKRLRIVPGIRSVTPVRVSPSSAQIRIVTTLSDPESLRSNLSMQGFDLQMMPNGELALTEK